MARCRCRRSLPHAITIDSDPLHSSLQCHSHQRRTLASHSSLAHKPQCHIHCVTYTARMQPSALRSIIRLVCMSAIVIH